MNYQLPAISHQLRSRRGLLVVAALVAGLALPWATPSAYGIVLLNQALIFTVVVVGLNFIYGFGGVFSLAQAAFWGIGAYTSALVTTDGHMNFLVGILAAALVTSLFGILVGLPTLKLRSHYLTMATLAFAEAVRLVLMNTDSLTHGAQGIRGIPPASLGPLIFDDPYKSYYLHLGVALVAMVFTVRFRRSRLGRALESTRDDELAAGASGVNVTHTRVLAFVLSALMAGIGGSLWAHFSAYISPETFDLFATIRFVSMLLIGGAGTALGPIVGAGLLTYLPEWLRFLEAWYMAIYGLSIVLILLFAPRGLVGLAGRLIQGLGEARIQGRGDGATRRHGDTATRGRGNAAKDDGPPLPLGEAWGCLPVAPRGEGASETGSVAAGFSLRGPGEAPDLPPADARTLKGAVTERGQSPVSSRQSRESGTHHSSLITHHSAQPPLLETRGLTIAFGGLVAVRGLDLSVPTGEIRGIIGPNGSGKTTLLNLTSGIYRPTAGEILLAGQRVDGLGPSELVGRGIARTFQNLRLFSQMSVLDNVKVAKYCRTRSGLGGILLQLGRTRNEERQVEKEALKILDFLGLASRAGDLPGDLSYGQRRLVEVARALATGPRLLLLDEPAAGMSPVEKERLVQLVRAIHGQGDITIIVIEHDMKVISGLCDQVTVLNYGEVIAEGAPQEVRENPAVIEAYLGRGRARAAAR